jgi:hypothetical protein
MGGRRRRGVHWRRRIWPEALADTAESGDELRRLEGVFAREKKGEGRGGHRPFIGEPGVGRGLGFGGQGRDRTAWVTAVGKRESRGGRGS